jgi:spoIIIJ-associated protein
VSEAGSELSLEAEAEGETVGEAKWTALKELERRFPGLDKESVAFAVVSEGERGLLGVGQVPARVIARLERAPAPAAREEPGSQAARLRDYLERVTTAIGVPASIDIQEDEELLSATLSGGDLGILIGKHGQTLDAIQYLANAILWRGGDERKDVQIDAAGYRERRRELLAREAERAARDALRTGEAVELEPMTAVERKIVHTHLQGRADVATESEGTEPNRHVVVRPL